MQTTHFLQRLDEEAIIAEIVAAERACSGEIRVAITDHQPEEVIAAATEEFERLGLHCTPQRNAVLIYLAPRVQKFAVIGDTAIHEKCGEAFWQEMAAELSTHLRAERFTEAALHGVRKAGRLLAQHFPPRGSNP